MTTTSALTTLTALELLLPVGLPGIGGARRFVLEPLGDQLNVFGTLRSLDVAALADGTPAGPLSLLVAAPGLLWPEYCVEVPDETAELLELEDPADAVALVVVTAGATLDETTANLFAPIVVNVARGLAQQVVPRKSEEEVGWPLRAPLPLPAVA